MVYLGHALGVKTELSAIENLKISLALAGVSADLDQLYDVLERTGLRGREELHTRKLSAGQKRYCPGAHARVPFRPLDRG